MKKLNDVLIFLLSILGIVFMVKYFISGDIVRALISLCLPVLMFLPKLLQKKIKINERLKLIYILYIFFLMVLGCIFKLYTTIYYYDSLAHFSFGVGCPIISFLLLKKFNKYDRSSIFFNVFFLLIVTLGLSALWEIFEFTNSKIFDVDVQHVLTTGVTDTMKDIILAFLGSILFSTWYIYKAKTNINGFDEFFE